MERETLLTLLIMLLGGLALQPLGALFPSLPITADGALTERHSWLRLWLPMAPLLLVAAWLCGWALTEPDPVPDVTDPWVIVALCTPFVFLFARAALRAAWALLRRPPDCGVSTIGLIQPQVVFSPFLAKQLDDGVIRAALAHEHSHARHRDPMRIWLAQIATDLQWPWPSATGRFRMWLDALEQARDDEARSAGADGAELAAAVLASVRFLSDLTPEEQGRLEGTQLAHARLIGDSRALKERVSRLLAPVCGPPHEQLTLTVKWERTAMLLVPLLIAALLLGALYGERVMHPLLALMS